MAGFFGRLLGRRQAAPAPERPMAPMRPDAPFAVIGDVHGCARLLDTLLTKLEAQAPEARIIYVGDLIDRGEESKQVLTRAMQTPGAVTLLGNHERMCLDFLDDPEGAGPRWMRNGGLQTLASFGISATGMEPLATRDALAHAMGDEMIGWMRGLPLFWKSGNLYVVHAAAYPNEPVEAQGERPLIWGTSRFTQSMREDGHWVIHGHTIVEMPNVTQGRIATDTGAYATGRLTAALVQGEEIEFIQSTYDSVSVDPPTLMTGGAIARRAGSD